MSSEANNSNDNGISGENIEAIEAELDAENTSAEVMLETEVNDAEVNETGVDEAVNSSPVVEGPLIQNTIPVTFETTK